MNTPILNRLALILLMGSVLINVVLLAIYYQESKKRDQIICELSVSRVYQIFEFISQGLPDKVFSIDELNQILANDRRLPQGYKIIIVDSYKEKEFCVSVKRKKISLYRKELISHTYQFPPDLRVLK